MEWIAEAHASTKEPSPPATVSSSLSASTLVAAGLIALGVSVLLMIFSIQAARTIRRWCGHTAATLSLPL
jgi:hypothetical protein